MELKARREKQNKTTRVKRTKGVKCPEASGATACFLPECILIEAVA
jgi:hypothetical protein